MWERLSLNLKLRISFGVLAFLLICVGIISTLYLNNTVKTFQHVSKINLANAITLGELDTMANHIQLNLLQMGLSDNPSDIKELDEKIKVLFNSFENSQKKYTEIPFVDGEEVLYNEFKTSWDILKAKFLDLKVLANASTDEAIKQFSTGYIQGSKDERDRFEKAIIALIKFQNNEGQTWAYKANEMAETAKRITTFIIVIAVIAAFFLALYISKNLTTTLRGLSLQIADGSHALAETSSEISSASDSLSSSVQEQAAAIQETSASAEELTAMVTKTEENAHRSYEISRESSRTAEKGKRAVEDVITAINRIHTGNEQIANSVSRNNQNIEEINRVILEITDKTKIINEIVFQTKLLSFNASVEAARAGEQGKGFAVVAEEVGNLATMSGNAAKDISQMLHDSTIKVQQIVQQTKDEMGPLTANSKRDVENGIKTANECDKVLNEIVSNVMSVDSLIKEITEASKESAKGILEITKAMGQLDQATQMNSTAANQSSLASKNLSDQAHALNNVSQTLKLTIEGRH